MNWEQETQKVTALEAELAHLAKAREEERSSLKKAKTRLVDARKAQEILQGLAQVVQQKAHERLATVVSSCLASVFPEEPYEFEIQFERRRGKTEAQLKFRRGDLLADPLTAAGGGVVDVAAFALRIACLIMHRPRLSPVVVLDEPFRFVSLQHQDAVRQMLERLSEDLKVQIIFVTHNQNLATGKIIEI